MRGYTMRFSSLYAILSLLAVYSIHPAPQPTHTPQNLIIATDLDDVVLDRNKGDIAKLIFKKLGRFKKLYNQYKKRKNSTGSRGKKFGEGFYIHLKNNNEHKLADLIKDVCISKKLKKGTVKIMRKMVNQGYSLFTATNIGSLFFAELQKKFPELFNNNFIQHGMTVDFLPEDIIEKPDMRYFEKLQTKLNPDGNKEILFIDDKLENVLSARKCGMLAIQFKNHKQLKRDLHTYGICTCK
jgi:HAD superfamily hydrolase (TIGR01509 family)